MELEHDDLRRECAALVQESSNSVLFFQKWAQHFAGFVLLRAIKLLNIGSRTLLNLENKSEHPGEIDGSQKML